MLLDKFRKGLILRRCLHNYQPLNPGKHAESLRKNTEWVGVVGLEIHAQINSQSKLFSGSATSFSAPTNTQVSLFDCATPGTLPVLNRRCVEAAVKTALALNCEIHPVSLFDRKHYFYADLPAGYQITQHFHPIANDGFMDYVIFTPGIDKEPRKFRASIQQVQLEQDSGKSLHNPDAGVGVASHSNRGSSLIDLNRAGIGLMEIITRPEFHNGEEASAFVRELVMLLRTLEVCDVRMFEGSLRVDVNVSVNRKGAELLGVRSEVKNLSSFKFVSKAVDFEISRQIELLSSGKEVVNETRGFDFKTETTHSMRDKEIQQDYRYMPEPNLPPLRLFNSDLGDKIEDSMIDIAKIKRELPELPSARRSRFIEELKLSGVQAGILLADDSLAEIFEKTILLTKSCPPKKLATLITNSLIAILNNTKKKNLPEEFFLQPKKFAFLADFLFEEKIPRFFYEKIMEELCTPEGAELDPKKIIEENKWFQINDENQLAVFCDVAMKADQKSVTAFKTGKTKAINTLVAAVKVFSNDLANLRKVKAIMEEKLTKQ